MTKKAGNHKHKGPIRQPGLPRKPRKRSWRCACPRCSFVRPAKRKTDLCQDCAQQARIDGSDTEGPRPDDPPRLWALHERAMARQPLFD